jgi:hypothetical protein
MRFVPFRGARDCQPRAESSMLAFDVVLRCSLSSNLGAKILPTESRIINACFDVMPRCSLSSNLGAKILQTKSKRGIIETYRDLSRLIATYRDLSRLIATYRDLSRIIETYRDLSGLIKSGKYDKQRDCESFVTNVTNVTPIFSTFLFSEEKNWEI